MRAGMGRALILATCLAVSRGAAHSQTTSASEDPWKAIRFLTGEWVGESEGESTYPPQPKNPKGEVHEHWSFFSHDRARRTLILRQFHQEGFVNQFAFAPPNAAGTLVFESEALENVPAGWKARETYQIVSPDEFVETFEIAPGNGPYEVYSKARFKRVAK